jgi:hypothetical protein
MDQNRDGWGEGMRHGFRIGPPGMWWHNPDLIQKLALTPDQQKRMDDILQQSRLQLVDLRANVEKQELPMERCRPLTRQTRIRSRQIDTRRKARGTRKGACQDAFSPQTSSPGPMETSFARRARQSPHADETR